MKTYDSFAASLFSEDAFLSDELPMLTEADEEALKWHKKHPIHHKNIVKHWEQASPAEKQNGMNWYKHAAHYVHVLAKDSGITPTQMAGLTANYSPQTDWHSNLLHAARVAKFGKGVGGKDQPSFEGRKMMASDQQRKNADAILAGKHYNDVLKGQKIRHFAHLIEHGHDGPDEGKAPHVVVDRHAHSVASGARISDKAFGISKLKSLKGYNAAANAYVKAAHHINKAQNTPHGHPDHVSPHQLQAVTWLVRQRLNDAEDHAAKQKTAALKGKHQNQMSLFPHEADPETQAQKAGWGKNREGSKERWNRFASQHHPNLVFKD